LVAVDVVGGRVADQQDRDAGAVEDGRGVLVVRGEHRPPLAALLGRQQVTGADPLAGRYVVQGCGHRRLLPPRGRRARSPGHRRSSHLTPCRLQPPVEDVTPRLPYRTVDADLSDGGGTWARRG